MAQKSLDLIEAMFILLEQINPATVRGVCYQLFVKKLIESMGRLNTNNISRLLRIGRERGDIPWHWIVDETRETEHISKWNSLGDFGETVVRGYRRNFWEHQDSWVKVVSEKATIGGVVRPVLHEFAVDFQVMHGYGSTTKLHEIAEESLIGERTLEILYIGDFDPSGMHISEVDLPGRVSKYGGDRQHHAARFDACRLCRATRLPGARQDQGPSLPLVRENLRRPLLGTRCTEPERFARPRPQRHPRSHRH